MSTGTQMQADMDAALAQVAAAFSAAQGRGVIRIKPPEGHYNLQLVGAGPLEAKKTRDGLKDRIVQKLTFRILDEAMKNQEFDYEFSITSGLKFGGEEWFQTFTLITGQPKRVNSDAEAMSFLRSEAPSTLQSVAGKVVFFTELKYNPKGYMKLNFQSARPYSA